MAKPLISRLLLENSNNSKEESRKRKAEQPLPKWNADQSAFKVSIPKKTPGYIRTGSHDFLIRKGFYTDS